MVGRMTLDGQNFKLTGSRHRADAGRNSPLRVVWLPPQGRNMLMIASRSHMGMGWDGCVGRQSAVPPPASCMFFLYLPAF